MVPNLYNNNNKKQQQQQQQQQQQLQPGTQTDRDAAHLDMVFRTNFASLEHLSHIGYIAYV